MNRFERADRIAQAIENQEMAIRDIKNQLSELNILYLYGCPRQKLLERRLKQKERLVEDMRAKWYRLRFE